MEEERDDAEQQEGRGRADQADHQHRPSTDAADEGDADERREDGYDAVQDVGDEGALNAEPGPRQDLGAVVHDGIDAGHLLHDADSDAYEQYRTDPRNAQRRPAAYVGGCLRGG